MRRYLYLVGSILFAVLGVWCLVRGTRHQDLRFIGAALFEFLVSFLMFSLGYEDPLYEEEWDG